MDIKTIGAAVVSKIEHLIQPMVGRNDLAKIIGYIENAGAPSAVVPDFIGQRLFDTSGLQFYVAFGVAAGEWTPLGASTLSAAELALLDGALSTNAVATKAAVIDATGILALSNNKLATEAGAGITGGTGTVYKSSVSKLGGIIRTSILIDLTGLSSSTTDLDIIGQGASVAHLGQITAARTGTILTGRVTCLEAPVGGVTDIDLYSATEGTGVFDGGIAALAETALLTSGAAWTLGRTVPIAAVPAANEYLYLTGGAAGTAAAYTAGKFLIELEGYDAA
jgi:hypothetical protein